MTAAKLLAPVWGHFFPASLFTWEEWMGSRGAQDGGTALMSFVCTIMTMEALTRDEVTTWMQMSLWKVFFLTGKHKQKFLVENVLCSKYPGLVFFFCFSFSSLATSVVTMETEWSAPREGLREQQMQYGWECSMLDCGKEIKHWVTNSISPLPRSPWSSTHGAWL